MALRNGNLVRLYLYKGVWTLTEGGSGTYKLRVDGEETAVLEIGVDGASQIQSALLALDVFDTGDVAVSGTSSPFTITLGGDFLCSGIPIEIADADATATITIARSFPATHATVNETNGFYLMGAEYNLDKSYDLEIQDVTSKSSSGWKESVAQVRSSTLSASNFFLTEENFTALKNQWMGLHPVIICDIDPQEDTSVQNQNYGVYNITSLQETSNQNGVVEFSASFELTGSITEVFAT